MLFLEKLRYTQNNNSLRKIKRSFPPMNGQSVASEKACFCASLKRGSLTAEAAAVLPLFLLACFMLIGMLQIYRVRSMVGLSLDSGIRKLGMYAYATGKEHEIVNSLGCQGFLRGYLKLPENCQNLRFLESSWDGSKIRVSVQYEYHLPIKLFPVMPIRLENRACVHGWVGDQGEFAEGMTEEEEEEMVFITEHESVYHTKRGCTYLQLTVFQTGATQISGLRNEKGQYYHACEKCGGKGNTVYFSPQGEAYHSSTGCSGLTRKVKMVKKSEAEHLGLCSRCEGRRGL